MRNGDRVECINELSPLYHHVGRMCGVTKDGRVLVQFAALGPDWEVPFDAHDLELAQPIVQYWEASPWIARLAMVAAKHERSGGPDEQQLADWGRSS